MSEPHDFDVAKTAYKIPVNLIDPDPEAALRPLDLDWVAALQGMFTNDGQDDPIEIFQKPNGRYGMTKGRHRLAAATGLNWPTIDAFIDLESRRREVSENLLRLGLCPIDRAAFVAELILIEKVRAGLDADANIKSVLATARWKDRIGAEADDASLTMRLAFGLTEEVAAKVGLSRQTIYRDLELHRGLRPDVVAAIRDLPVAANAAQLRTLARLPEGDQRAVTGLLVEGTAKGVTDALATLKQAPVKSPAQKAVSAIRGNWARLSARELKALIRDLPMPAGVTLIIDGETIGAGE